MFEKLMNNLVSTFFIQIWRNRIKVTHIKSGRIFDDTPLVTFKDQSVIVGQQATVYADAINPFSHPRVIVDDYETAAILFRYGIEKIMGKGSFFSPVGVIQIMEERETPLTKLEKKALIEIAMEAGFQKGIVYEGKPLDISDIKFNDLLESPHSYSLSH